MLGVSLKTRLIGKEEVMIAILATEAIVTGVPGNVSSFSRVIDLHCLFHDTIPLSDISLHPLAYNCLSSSENTLEI